MNDNEKMASEAEMIIKNHEVWVTIEVVAEVIYVLKGVYKVKKNCILTMEIIYCIVIILE